MKKNIIILLIALIVIVVVAVYLGMPGSTEPSSHPPAATLPVGPVVEIVDTNVGYSPLGTPYFYGTVKSHTAMPVTAVIGAGIYDESGRIQFAHGYSEVSIAPYEQLQYRVTIFNLQNLRQNWEYRVYVEDVS